MRRVAVIAVLVVAATLAAAAAAAAGVRITGVDASEYPHVRVTVIAPPGSARPQLTENGQPISGLHAVSLAATKRIVLAVDRSRSMAGASLVAATSAARAFVARKSAADGIEVVSFGRRARSLGPFSTSIADAGSALGRIAVDRTPGTALWDAVSLAARSLSDTPAGEGRVIVVVTDGSDVSSTTSRAQAIAAAHRAHATVYAVGIASKDFSPVSLRELSAETAGAFLQATSSAQLAGLYSAIGESLSRTWQLDYLTVQTAGARVRLTAVVPGSGSGDEFVNLGSLSASSGSTPTVLPGSVWRSTLAPLVISAAVGLLVLLAALFASAARGRDWLTARLAPHLAPAHQRKNVRPRSSARDLPKRLFAATEHAFANVKQFRTLQRLLVRADLPLIASELVYVCLGGAVVLVVAAALAGAPALLVFVLGWLGAFAPIGFVVLKARSRISAFDEQLPDLLTTIAASLKAGHSFRAAIQSVVDEGADPASKEFRQVLAETRLGRPMDDALSELSERIGSNNLSFALSAVTIQRQIGGSLAGLFEMVAETVRQRQQFARKIRALTAMGRMSAYVLVGLPFMVALVVTTINSGYMAPLWGTSTGHKLVGAGLAMIAFGSLILKKIVSFRG